MKNLSIILAAMLVGAAALSSCNSLEVTLPRGPQGEQGIRGISGTDGLSAYELWAKAVSEGTIPDWDGGKTTVSDYFIYLKGADGENGKDGKSAYELWKEYISSGDIPSPKDPETPWAADNDSERDFYEFLTGADGDDGLIPSIGDNGNWFIGGIDTGVPATGPEGPAGPAGTSGKDGKDGKDGTNGKDGSNGKSAYEVWKEYIEGGNDSSWPKTLVSEYHYFLYLKGEKGDKGDQGDKGEQGTSGDTPYVGDNGHWHVGNTDTGVPATGDAGADGLSAYQLWKQEVLSENGLANPGNGVFDAEDYPLWPSDAVSLADFWSYLTGKDGKSAYELWKEYISDGTAEDPKNPGSTWAPEADTEADFYYYLTGPDGKDGIDGDDGADGIDGLSAYELWKKDVLSDSGLSNPGNGVYDMDEYPLWPTDAVSQEDFWLYLRGRDGKDGSSSSSEENKTLEYAEEADADMYNVAPVRALMKIASSTDTTYEYVNPYSGGAAFIVTGPGPVIIPDCEVVFNDVKGNTYSKKSDGNGYVYLSRSELPDYQEGDPSAGTGLKPVSFKFGGRTVTDASKIAATCKVPYKVGISVQMTGSTLMPQNLSYDKMLVRTVEGNEESSWGGVPYPLNSGGNGYFYYRSKSALAVFKEEIGSVQYNESEYTYTADALTASNKRNMELTVNINRGISYNDDESTNVTYASFGDGAEPAVVEAVSPVYTIRKSGDSVIGIYKPVPDYGVQSTSLYGTLVPSLRYMGQPKGLKLKVVLGKTTFTGSLDESTFGRCYEEGPGTLRNNVYTFNTYSSLNSFKSGKRGSFSGFIHVVGVHDKTKINNYISLTSGSWSVLDIYDGFSIFYAAGGLDVNSSSYISYTVSGSRVSYSGANAKFSWDLGSDPDDMSDDTASYYDKKGGVTIDCEVE